MTEREKLPTISGIVMGHEAHIPFPCDPPEIIEDTTIDASEVKLHLQIYPTEGEVHANPRIEEHIATGLLARTLFQAIQDDSAHDISLVGRKVTIGYDPKINNVTMTEQGGKKHLRTVDSIQLETPGGVRVLRNSSKK